MPRSDKKKSWLKPPQKSPTFQESPSPDQNELMKVEQSLMLKRGIASGRKHGINLSPGKLNSGSGNCAFEASIYNVNERDCFEHKFPFTPDYYRRIWAVDMKNRTKNDETWKIYSDSEWEAGWQEMMETGVYERGIFGDLMLLGIACGLRKRLLIFNTHLDSPHDPIYVCDPCMFGIEPDTEIPVVLAYNMSHYESLHPDTDIDTVKTTTLVVQYMSGQYIFARKDLPFLINLDEITENSESDRQADDVNRKEETIKEAITRKKSVRIADAEKRKSETVQKRNTNETSKMESDKNIKIKRKNMTSDQKKDYMRKMRRHSRTNESDEAATKRRESNRAAMNKRRVMETEEEATARKESERIAKDAKRKGETVEEAAKRSSLDRKAKDAKRDMETEGEAAARKESERIAKDTKRKGERVEEAAKRKVLDRKAKDTKRKIETQEEAAARKESERIAKDAKRKGETVEEAAKRKGLDRKAKEAKRDMETEEETAARKESARKAKDAKRKMETEEEALARKSKDLKAKAVVKAMPFSMYAARNAQKVLYGEQIVPEIEVGRMDNICCKCGARKWKSETTTVCCNNGKIHLTPFPDPPSYLKYLWTADTIDARLFREQSRPFNNALALSSIKVTERKFNNGFSPSVVFEGKVQHMYGPLLPENNETPKFAQLYVHDPATQHTMRIQNMNLPKTLTIKQVDTITNIMKKLQKLMEEVNPYVKDFKHICEIPEEEIIEGKLVISCKGRPKGAHERRYNKQTNLAEVSVLTNSEPGDLVLRKRGGGLQFVYDIHPSAQPLHFTVLFPFGTDGYNEETKHVDGDVKRRVTPREFFAYHLNMRNLKSDFLFRARRLFQEYICIAFTTIQSQKLKFHRKNQTALRADTYKNVREVLSETVPMKDRVHNDDHNLKLGKRIVLARSFVGSPRWYNSEFQDAMAICREYHKPDFFITMTCNQHWEEIKRELRKGESAKDRPDLVARVFKQKKDQLLKDINSSKVFGKVPAVLWVIEFQKRGLPHVHILVILSDFDRLSSATEVEDVICAELPPDPEMFPLGSKERAQAERLEMIVLKNMVHGPCGKENPASPCMNDGKCTKNFPKKFCDKTILDPDNTYPEHRRLAPEKGGRSIVTSIGGKEYVIDNRWIVSYSPYLCLRFNCHTNIVLCLSPTAPKYLYKYIYKGEDRAMVRTEVGEDDTTRDEISDFEDLRSVGSSEAAWQIFNFNISKKHPAVYALRCHLEDEQHVVFDAENLESAIEQQRTTELTAFFEYNTQNPDERTKYVDFPKKFVWKDKKWNTRKASFDTIGRVHSIHPAGGDVFYLRMLLHHDHCMGKTSFDDLKTLDGEICESYQEVCRLLGLLQDDKEWDDVLTEGSITKLSSALRELFVTILLFSMPANPRELFENHFMEWTEDFKYEAEGKGITLDDQKLKTLVLIDLKRRFQSRERQLSTFGLKEPNPDELAAVSFSDMEDTTALLKEELNFNQVELKKLVDERTSHATNSQRVVFETAIEAVENGGSLYLFIDARGGTGKTYVLNAILAAVRLLDLENGGSVALAVGTTGIASNLLHLGRTFHSRFKAPLNPNEDSVLSIDVQSNLADLIRKTKIIVIDEAPMLHKYQLEAMDRTLIDIMDVEKPFGGKILILSGDFRQTLPVIPGASSATIIDSAINRSYLWRHFKILKLEENMRVKLSSDPHLDSFDKWTLSIGDGEIPTLDEADTIEIPDDICMEIKPKSTKDPLSEKNSMKALAEHVFPNLKTNFNKCKWMEGRAILAPTNKQVNEINDMITDSFPGKPHVLSSSDELINPTDLARFNIEYLNSLNPSGLPAHRLFIKPGMPLMLLRNLNPKMGLCNGTKLIFNKVHKNYLLECSIAGGEFNSRKVLIPRITLRPNDREFSFEWTRRQFPVRVGFAMTINKSQGQTLQNVGVWLNDSCFTHGQLYVAVSRVGSPSNIKLAIRRDLGSNSHQTRNVVFKTVFQNIFATGQVG